MTATNMCSNFGGLWYSPPVTLKTYVLKIYIFIYYSLSLLLLPISENGFNSLSHL